VAEAAAMGAVSLPAMKERKYNMQLAFGVIAAGGTLGILIPPSVIMIFYGAFEGLSVGKLFASGVVPGIILAGSFLVTVIIAAKIWPHLTPKPETYSWKQRKSSLRELIPSLILILVVLGGVFAGIMTPTEAAAFGCAATIILGGIYKVMSWKVIKGSIEASVRITAMIMFIAVFAKALAFVMQYLGAGEKLSEILLGAQLGKFGTLALIYAAYIVLGMFFEGISMMLLTLPFVVPIINGLGLSLYWFNVPLVIMIEASLITPPVGMNLFVLQSLAPEHDVLEVAKGTLPFLLPMILVVIIVSIFPEIVLWLPDLIY
jgi:tripartite ATP-independent transporter DctM subunit